jgi:hypothetical protein
MCAKQERAVTWWNPTARTHPVQDFLHTSRLALGPTQPPVQWVSGLLPGVKWPGRGADYPPPSSAKVTNEKSYTYLPLWAFKACLRAPYHKGFLPQTLQDLACITWQKSTLSVLSIAGCGGVVVRAVFSGSQNTCIVSSCSSYSFNFLI